MSRLNKTRADAWDATLDEPQRWAVYERFRRGQPWHLVAKWIAREYKIAAPSRTALYRWAARMRSLESAHRIEQAITARDEVDALAAAAGQHDEQLISAYKTLAADLAMRQGDAATAAKFTRMALDLAAAQTKRAEVELKAAAQATRDDALALARAKFEAAEGRLAAVRSEIDRARTAGAGITEDTLKRIEEAAKLL